MTDPFVGRVITSPLHLFCCGCRRFVERLFECRRDVFRCERCAVRALAEEE